MQQESAQSGKNLPEPEWGEEIPVIASQSGKNWQNWGIGDGKLTEVMD
jgi:hypothetical protein